MALPQKLCILGILISERQDGGEERTNAPLAMPEDEFCRQLCRFGRNLGLLVYLFDSSGLESASRRVAGYSLEDGLWNPGSYPPPDVVYDRSLCRNAEQRRRRSISLAELKLLKPFVLLNGTLPGKLDVYAALQDDEQLRPWLPLTMCYSGAELASLERRYPDGLFLKPSAGSHGRGAVRLSRWREGCRIDGRDRRNEPISLQFDHFSSAAQWLERFIGTAVYTVQPYLRLNGSDGMAFDVRVLMQKDETGRWCYTGSALRKGSPGSVTANLHGGGTARKADDALSEQFGSASAAKLLARMRRIAGRAAVSLEERFGRLAELGFDFGVEPDGRLWLLEANAKPGRQSFAGDEQAARNAVLRPLRYARLLAGGHSPIMKTDIPRLFKHHEAVPVNADDRIQRRYVQEVHP
ncbi:YheC/YheD family protein [Paenibacillus sp. sptzw28]|uniref:YheC/YheD family endospore coat-associated protein n=1 Tax=Paenibacillus sp. sptzw28 TaxID=715179 RepID=UPI001C6F4C9E|nr:YheC/YheD family protein [Paenibacillus sp. sptzw28]QYR20408.1 YheC/YheD family protein [Paenibacillus sp. sptzw28]